MSDEPTQQTAKGVPIPVPTRGDVLRDLRKVAKAADRDSDARRDLDGPEEEQ